MTRPMPGPPEWYDIDWNPVWGMVWVKEPDECDQTFNHAELDKKRLTMEGCAAHYWQADGECLALGNALIVGWSNHETVTNADIRAETWERFKDTPHALEES